MAGISMSALRRALAEMAAGAGRGVRQAYGGSHIDRGIAYGGLPGAVVGGAIGAGYDDDNILTNETGASMVAGALGGALLGAGGGGMAKLASMGIHGASGGARGLREALAEAAAARGMGRQAMRAVDDVEDAARFRAGPPREFTSAELRDLGQGPTARYGSGDHWMDSGRANPMVEMGEMQAMRDALRRLNRSRASARSQAELDDIDMEIAVLKRDLGIIPWD